MTFWLPPGRAQRNLALIVFVHATGRGAYVTAGVLYFTQSVGLPVGQVGVGLSAAGLLALAAGPPVGHLADRCGARGVFTAALLCGSAAIAALALARGFWTFLAAACATAFTHTAGLAARGPLVADHGRDRPHEFRGYLRSVSNIGIALGTVPAGWAVQTGTRSAYLALILGTAASSACAAALTALLPATRPIPSDEGSRWVALKDGPYAVLTVLDGVLAVQFKVLTITLPLWIVTRTDAPNWLISATMLVNTAMVGTLQTRVTRNAGTPPAAGRAIRRAGFTFLVSCAVIVLSAGMPGWAAAATILAAVVVHTVGELWHAAGGFELSYALAPPHAIGQYQGLFGMGLGAADFFGPAMVTALCIQWGRPGWFVLGGIFAGTGLLVPPAVAVAERRTGRTSRSLPRVTSSRP
ncbi:MFS transporter [Actinomadura darangshiensis]|uniref:MFS transporter n=1 Tax=Actinomadura darangshiensis TaxID=705336 RepID=A0A4R5AQ82_9ACTN|nr:MFS transporter [Actinomadura darangshiensis]TDD74325.1 MFS transporter [Actinomadura darangshiensis]